MSKMQARSVASMALTMFLLGVTALAETKGSVSVSLRHSAFLNGQQIESGDYRVRWVKNSPEAKVEFMRKGKVVASAEGEFVERDSKARYDGVMTKRDGRGREVITEIRFRGKKGVLVFKY